MFSWVDLGTPDLAGAETFYEAIFGWQAEEMPAGGDFTYTMFSLKGKKVAAAYTQREDQKGRPPMWTEHFTVESADKAAAKAQELGGKVTDEPVDVFDSGRMVLIESPTGEFFGAWEPKTFIGAELVNEHGTLVWNELMTTDVERSKEFYTRFFGWTAQDYPEMDGYVVFSVEGRGSNGMTKISEEMGDHPSYWSTCFAVDDADATVKTATDNGGKVVFGPKTMEGIGRFAVIQDPQGAAFSIMAVEGEIPAIDW
ncbi:MAG: uncharacterized protein QOG04_1682 [Actinomycetota bacterium]|nr:uncharacterized protein [Actinomycetota bacterium]